MRYVLAILTSAAIATVGVAGEVRTWTARDGKKMDGELVRRDGTDVILAREGKEHRVPIARLSDEDRQYVESKGEDADDPFAKPPSESNSSPAKTPKKKEPPKKYELRNWKDAHGNQVSAKFLRVAGLNVVLERPGGRLLTVPEATLSLEDRNYIREQMGLPALPEPTNNQVAANNNRPGNAFSNPTANPVASNSGVPSSTRMNPMNGIGNSSPMPAVGSTNSSVGASSTGGAASTGSYTPPLASSTSSPYGAPPPMTTAPSTPPATTSTPSTTSTAGSNFNPPIATTTAPAYSPAPTTTPASTPTATSSFNTPSQTATAPSFPTPNHSPFSQPQGPTFQEVFECSKCRNKFTKAEVQGLASCPKCRVIWNNAGQVTGASAYAQGRAVGFVVGPLLIISIIVALVRKFGGN